MTSSMHDSCSLQEPALCIPLQTYCLGFIPARHLAALRSVSSQLQQLVDSTPSSALKLAFAVLRLPALRTQPEAYADMQPLLLQRASFLSRLKRAEPLDCPGSCALAPCHIAVHAGVQLQAMKWQPVWPPSFVAVSMTSAKAPDPSTEMLHLLDSSSFEQVPFAAEASKASIGADIKWIHWCDGGRFLVYEQWGGTQSGLHWLDTVSQAMQVLTFSASLRRRAGVPQSSGDKALLLKPGSLDMLTVVHLPTLRCQFNLAPGSVRGSSARASRRLQEHHKPQEKSIASGECAPCWYGWSPDGKLIAVAWVVDGGPYVDHLSLHSAADGSTIGHVEMGPLLTFADREFLNEKTLPIFEWSPQGMFVLARFISGPSSTRIRDSVAVLHIDEAAGFLHIQEQVMKGHGVGWSPCGRFVRGFETTFSLSDTVWLWDVQEGRMLSVPPAVRFLVTPDPLHWSVCAPTSTSCLTHTLPSGRVWVLPQKLPAEAAKEMQICLGQHVVHSEQLQKSSFSPCGSLLVVWATPKEFQHDPGRNQFRVMSLYQVDLAFSAKHLAMQAVSPEVDVSSGWSGQLSIAWHPDPAADMIYAVAAVACDFGVVHLVNGRAGQLLCSWSQHDLLPMSALLAQQQYILQERLLKLTWSPDGTVLVVSAAVHGCTTFLCCRKSLGQGSIS